MPFINEFFFTDEIINEFLKRKKKISIISSLTILLFSILITLIFISLHIYFIVGFLCFFIVLLLLSFSTQIFRKTKNTPIYFFYKNQYKNLIIFDDKITINNGSSTYSLNYSNIRRIKVLKHSILLQNNLQIPLLIVPNAFISGNYEDFITFILEKTNLKLS